MDPQLIESAIRLIASTMGVDEEELKNRIKSKYGGSYENLPAQDTDAMLQAITAEAGGGAQTPAAAATAQVPAATATDPTSAAQKFDYRPPTPPSGQKFSQYDDVFKKYAGSLANDSDFLRIVNATVKAESGHNPNAVGDGGKSIGLFQMHEQGAGAGMSAADRSDPDKASSVMIPRFVAMYQQGKQQGLSGTDLASFVARNVERPLGYEDPNGAAARKYISAYQAFGGQLGAAYPGAENDTGNPNPYQWKQTSRVDNEGNQIFARPLGSVPTSEMTSQESQVYYPFMENPTQSAYNMVSGLGRDPFNGNPFNSLLMRTSADLGRQSFLKTLMDTGSASNYGDVANTAQSALTSGRTSLLDDPRSLIASMKNLAANKGVGASTDQQLLYQDLADPGKVSSVLSDILGPTVSPYLRRNLSDMLRQKMLRVNQEAPSTDQNPFIALTRMLGY